MISANEEYCKVDEEVEEFMKLFNVYINEDNTIKLSLILKKVIFIKNFVDNFDIENRHYKKYVIYDILMMFYSIKQNSIRNYYNYFRSFIENFMRVNLKLNDSDETSVNNIYKRFNKLDKSDDKGLSNFLEEKYSYACNYVHSNIKANVNIYEYYKDIIESDEFNEVLVTKIFIELDELLDRCITFLIFIYTNEVDSNYYRKKKELKYIIGEGNFDLFNKLIQ